MAARGGRGASHRAGLHEVEQDGHSSQQVSGAAGSPGISAAGGESPDHEISAAVLVAHARAASARHFRVRALQERAGRPGRRHALVSGTHPARASRHTRQRATSFILVAIVQKKNGAESGMSRWCHACRRVCSFHGTCWYRANQT